MDSSICISLTHSRQLYHIIRAIQRRDLFIFNAEVQPFHSANLVLEWHCWHLYLYTLLNARFPFAPDLFAWAFYKPMFLLVVICASQLNT